jgi:hypothetical protein
MMNALPLFISLLKTSGNIFEAGGQVISRSSVFIWLLCIELLIFVGLYFVSGFGGLVVTQDRGFEPGRSCRIFRAKKIHSMPSFGGEVKPSVSYYAYMKGS